MRGACGGGQPRGVRHHFSTPASGARPTPRPSDWTARSPTTKCCKLRLRTRSDGLKGAKKACRVHKLDPSVADPSARKVTSWATCSVDGPQGGHRVHRGMRD